MRPPDARPELRAFSDAVLRVPAYRSTWFDPGPDEAKLNHNENPEDLADPLRALILHRLGASPWFRYPDAESTGLRAALAAHLGVRAEQVAIGNGANTLIGQLAAALHPAASLVVPVPGYPLYPRAAALRGLDLVPVPLRGADSVHPFALDIEALLSAIASRERPVVCLQSPHNPTGARRRREEIVRILSDTEGLVLVDEAYAEFAGASLVDELDRHPNLMILRTFSKAAALAGWRIGALVGHPEVVAQVGKLGMPYHVGLPAQVAATAVLEHPELLRARVAEIIRARDGLAGRLRGLPGARVFDSATNFLMVGVGDRHERLMRALADRRIVVRSLGSVAGLRGCVRLSVGTSSANDRVVQAFREALA